MQPRLIQLLVEAGLNPGQLVQLNAAGTAYAAGLRFTASAAASPAVGDDNTTGYGPGSLWVRLDTDEAWICVDASTGAAVWKNLADKTINTISTVDATVTPLATIAIPDDTTALIDVRVVARRTNAADRAGYIRRAVVYRESGGGATIQVPVQSPFTRESSGSWNCTIDVSGNNARIIVKGAVGHDINWKSEYFDVLEVG